MHSRVEALRNIGFRSVQRLPVLQLVVHVLRQGKAVGLRILADVLIDCKPCVDVIAVLRLRHVVRVLLRHMDERPSIHTRRRAAGRRGGLRLCASRALVVALCLRCASLILCLPCYFCASFLRFLMVS